MFGAKTHAAGPLTIFLFCAVGFLLVVHYGPMFVETEHNKVLGAIVAFTGTLLWLLYNKHTKDMGSLSTRVKALEDEAKEVVTKDDLQASLQPIHNMLLELVRRK